MIRQRTTLENLIAAALSANSNDILGATYSNRFAFDYNKYAVEVECKDGKNLWVSLCEVDNGVSHEIVAHCLTISSNELLAPIYAQFLWADLISLVHNNHAYHRINLSDFALAILNHRDDDLVDRANDTIERVFKTTTEYEKHSDEVHCFVSKEYGPVYINEECLEYYVDALQALPKDIQERVANNKLTFAKKIRDLSKLKGDTKKAIEQSAIENKLKLLDEIIDIVDPYCFSWALNAYRDIEAALVNTKLVKE